MAPVRQISSPIERQVKAEFTTYWASIEKARIENPDKQRSLVASAHKYARCFSYLARALTPLPANRRIFFQELTSDAVHLVHALVSGDARGARFYLRSVVENFWRHHYFRDHVVEYGWLHTRDKYFLEMKALRDHCGWLDCFQGPMKGMVTNLPNIYQDLSSSVHSSSAHTLVLRETLDDIHLREAQGKELSKDLLRVLKVCMALCIYSEKEVFLGLHVNVQEFLLKNLSAGQRSVVIAALSRANPAVT